VTSEFGPRLTTWGHFIPTIHEMHADKDTVVILFDAEGTARDGVAYKNTYAWFLTFASGKIVKATAFYDSILFNEFGNAFRPWHRQHTQLRRPLRPRRQVALNVGSLRRRNLSGVGGRPESSPTSRKRRS
jgi:hypothetical protein